jgi:hypothetical protein
LADSKRLKRVEEEKQVLSVWYCGNRENVLEDVLGAEMFFPKLSASKRLDLSC